MRCGPLLVLLTSLAALHAQTPFACTAGASSNPTHRPRAQADFSGVYTLNCAGTRPAGGITGNIRITLNTTITSRLLTGAGNASEALLLIDQPAPGAQVPRPAGSVVTGENVIQGVQTALETVEFQNVVILPPGPAEQVERVFHVVNIRANSTQLPPSGAIRMTATFAATAGIAIVNATQTVATSSAGAAIQFAVRSTDDAGVFAGQLDGCAGNKFPVAADTPRDFNLKFTETTTSQFRERNIGTTPAAPFDLGNQSEPSAEYGTESGFFSASFPSASGMNLAGLATQGTRLMARFTNLPPGVRIWATTQPVAQGTSQTGITARLTLSDANGAGVYNEAPPLIGSYRELTVTGGAAVAVWEVLDSSRLAIESLSFGIVISVPPNLGSFAQLLVNGLHGPVTTAPLGVAAPAPNFLDGGPPATVAQITSCNPAPAIVTACPLTAAGVGVPYSLALAAEGGFPPYSWSLSEGGLPNGLTLAANGTISGTPAAEATAQFTLRVTDAAGGVATRQCSLQVFTAITIATACPLTDAALGAPYAHAIQVTGGVGPYTFSIVEGSLPPGLSIGAGLVSGVPGNNGTYQFVIQVRDNRGATAQKQCSLRVLGPFRLSPLVLNFALPTGDGPSPPQLISVTGDNIGAGWTVGAITGGHDWLIASPNSGRMPGTVSVSVDARRLAPGTYNGLVTVSSVGAAAQSLSVAVTMVVTLADPPHLAPRPTGFSIAVPRGTGRRNLLLEVLNGGAGQLAFTATIEHLRGQGWLSLTTSAAGTTPARLRLTVEPAALLPGVYQARVRLRSAEGEVLVPVSLGVSIGTEAIELSSTGLHFTVVEGGPSPLPQGIQIVSRGAGPINWSATATVDLTLPTWFFLSNTSGQAVVAAADPGKAANRETALASREIAGQSTNIVRVLVQPAGLPPGRYFGEVLVSAQDVDNSPQLLAVTLDVLPQSASLPPAIAPDGLLFAGSPGGPNPSRQSVTLHNPARTALTYQADIDGNQSIWTVALPEGGSVPSGATSRIEIAANTANLLAGVYAATLNIQSSADQQVRTVRLLLFVAPGAAPTARHSIVATPNEPRTVDVPCQPGALRILPVLLSSGFTAFTGLPMPIEVRVHTAAGAPMTEGAVNVILESAVVGGNSLIHLGGGYWSGTVLAPAQASAPAGLIVAAVDEAGQTGCTEIPGLVEDSQGPVIAEGGVVSPASFRPYAPLAPGGFVGIFGSRLAEGRGEAAGLPLPNTLGVTTARIVAAGPVPLLFAGVVDNFTQVNGVLPYNLPAGVIRTLVLANRTGRTYAPMLVASSQPSVFTVNRQGFGQAIVVHGANPFLLADPGAPIAIGESIVIYCEGLGPVTPEIAAGQPTPDSPLRRTVLQVRLTIDGREAQVLFAGLTPGFAGLYQVNAVVPQGARPGNSVEMIVTSGDHASPPVTLAVKQP